MDALNHKGTEVRQSVIQPIGGTMTVNRWIIRSLKSKTIMFSLLLAVLGAIQATMGVFSSVLTPEAYGLLTVVIGAIVAALRYLTTLPLDKK